MFPRKYYQYQITSLGFKASSLGPGIWGVGCHLEGSVYGHGSQILYAHVNYLLNSLEGGYIGDYIGEYYRVY